MEAAQFVELFEALELSVLPDYRALAQSLSVSGLATSHVHYFIRRLLWETPSSPLFWAILNSVTLPESAMDFPQLFHRYFTDSNEAYVTGLLGLFGKYVTALPAHASCRFQEEDLELDMQTLKRLCVALERLSDAGLSKAILARLSKIDLVKCTADYRADIVFCMKRIVAPDNADLLACMQHSACKAELACHLLQTHPGTPVPWLTLADCAAGACSAVKSVRRQSQYLLAAIFNVADAPLFWAIQDALDEYSSHLLKDIFVQVGSLIDAVPTLLVEALLVRALTHENDVVRKYVVSELIQRETADLVDRCFSDNFVVETFLPTLSSFPNIFLQAEVAKAARAVLARLTRGREALVFDFILRRSPHVKLVSELLDALAVSGGGCLSGDQLGVFVKSTVTLYPLYLRPSLVQKTVALVQPDNSSSSFFCFVATLPLSAPVPAAWTLSLDWSSLVSGSLLERLGRLRLMMLDQSQQTPVLEFLAAECLAFVSRVYASSDAVFAALALFTAALDLLTICCSPPPTRDSDTSLFLKTVCCEALVPAVRDALLGDSGELTRLGPLAARLLRHARGIPEVVEALLVTLELEIGVRTGSLLAVATAVSALEAVQDEHDLPASACLEMEISKSDTVVFVEPELVFGERLGWGAREDVIDAFETARWRLLGRATQTVAMETALGRLGTISVNQLEAFAVVFRRATRAASQTGGRLSKEDVMRVLNTVGNFVNNRSVLGLHGGSLRAVLDLAFDRACLETAPEECRKFVSKILTVSATSPGYGKALVACWTRLVQCEAASLVPFADAVADVLMTCEELEDDSRLTVASLLLVLELAPASLATAVVEKVLAKLDRSQDETRAQNRRECPMPESAAHRQQRGGWRATAALLPRIQGAGLCRETVVQPVFRLVSFLTQPDVRELQDLVLCHLAVTFPDVVVREICWKLDPHEAEPANAQTLCSCILAAGFAASRNVEGERLTRAIVPYLTSNTAIVRAQAQFWLASEALSRFAEADPTLGSLRDFLVADKDAQVVLGKLRPVFARLEHHQTGGLVEERLFMEDLKAAVREGMTQLVLARDASMQNEEAVAPSVVVATQMGGGFFQRKYEPEVEKAVGNRKTQLVILASFVDKVTNLAGLSRTAEIFGARKLLIGNEKLLKDREFKGMSMTSELWLDIEEVKNTQADVLHTFCQYRAQGYSIVALEQTSSSRQLGEWKFPEKTLLVLGSEGQGVPVWALADIDTTVEIPQIGLVRSLNVHVSAALAVWEYNRDWALRTGLSTVMKIDI